jgi:hypothetical protein
MISPQAALAGLRRIVGGFALLLVIATWALWWEPASADNPRIPWFGWLCQVPAWVDRAAVVALVAGLLLMTVGPARTRFWQRLPLGISFAGWSVLLLLDQHRVQPWAWQFVLFDILFLLAWNANGLRFWRWIICSIYVYSAISKFDAAFLSSHGQLLLQGMLEPLGISMAFWSPGARAITALLFPIGELLTAVLLLIPRARFLGLCASVAMHLSLVWTLGISLGHEWGVILWNLFFLVQNTWIFGIWSGREANPANGASPRPARKERGAFPFLIFVLCYPALEPVELWDHWPAWAVYCSRPAQLRVLIAPEAAEGLPGSMQGLLGLPAPLEDRLPLRLERWAFQTRNCPLYPQLRYRLALARELLAGHVEDGSVIFEIAMSPNRWTGARHQVTLIGLRSVEHFEERYFFNTRSRQ